VISTYIFIFIVEYEINISILLNNQFFNYIEYTQFYNNYIKEKRVTRRDRAGSEFQKFNDEMV